MKFKDLSSLRKHLIGAEFLSAGLDIALEQFCNGVISARGPAPHPVVFEWPMQSGEKVKMTFIINVDPVEAIMFYEVLEIEKNDRNQFFEIVGMSEAAQILGWSVQYVQTYIKRGLFPVPFQRIAAGPLWSKDQILAYKKSKE